MLLSFILIYYFNNERSVYVFDSLFEIGFVIEISVSRGKKCAHRIAFKMWTFLWTKNISNWQSLQSNRRRNNKKKNYRETLVCFHFNEENRSFNLLVFKYFLFLFVYYSPNILCVCLYVLVFMKNIYIYK